jgi:hypothetical protein
MPNIEIASLSVNQISSLSAFSSCRNLKELHLRQNLLRSFAELEYLRPIEGLRQIALAENPIAEDPDYRAKVAQCLPQLEVLDGLPVTDSERAGARRPMAAVPPPVSMPVPMPSPRSRIPQASHHSVGPVQKEDWQKFQYTESPLVRAPRASSQEHQTALLSAVLALLPELNADSLTMVLQSIGNLAK